MKNILIFSGGTGSIALQNSIARYYGNNVNVDIIISAYDNGKSTGECRKAFDNNILGPSDLRKNQLTQFKIQKDCIKNDKNKKLLDFFEYRFDARDAESAYKIILREIEKIHSVLNNDENELIHKLIKNFFFNSSDLTYRSQLKYLNFNDFSISNILYASCANINNNSLTEAGTIMAKLLGIKNNVHLISDTNVYLYAITENGYLITDEAEIVDWKRQDDKIKNVKLLTKYGKEHIPAVDDDLNDNNKCKKLINNADIIIFSSGTQWSSLIPTYMHKNFKEYIKKSNAAKYIIMNNVPDKDMFGIDAKKLLEIVNNYVDLSDFTGVFNDFANNDMQLTDEIISSNILKNCISFILSDKPLDKKHNDEIFPCIMKHYYKKYINKSHFIFDFDDTLWARNINDKSTSLKNIKFLNNFSSYIVSGNSINKFKNAAYEYKREYLDFPKCLDVIFCNGGNSVYKNIENEFIFVENLNSEYNINNMLKLIQHIIELDENNINISMFENRGNSILSIKPIQDNNIRKELSKKINEYFKKSNEFNDYVAYPNGKTTIDIMKKTYTKAKIVNILLKNNNINDSSCLYVGDEITSGNDKSISSETNIDYIEVKDVYDTYALLETLLL